MGVGRDKNRNIRPIKMMGLKLKSNQPERVDEPLVPRALGDESIFWRSLCLLYVNWQKSKNVLYLGVIDIQAYFLTFRAPT